MRSNNKTWLVVGAVLFICGLCGFAYHAYQDNQRKQQQAQLDLEHVNCEQQAQTYLQQYNATPLLPQHNEYLTEYNDAVSQCKQEY